MEKKKMIAVWFLEHNKLNVNRVCEKYGMTVSELLQFVGRYEFGFDEDDVKKKLWNMRSYETMFLEQRRKEEKEAKKERRRRILAEVKAKIEAEEAGL